MSNALQKRARAFLERPVPAEINYTPDSISERFIAEYAERGRVEIDAELMELLQLCAMESGSAASQKSGEAAEYFGESHALLSAILDEAFEPPKKPWWKIFLILDGESSIAPGRAAYSS